MRFQERLARRAKNLAPSAIRELIRFMGLEGMISLGGGYPNPETFVFKKVDVEFKSGQKIAIEGKDLENSSQYGPSDAHVGLRREILAWHQKKDGITLGESQIVVLNGCQEGLFIMAYLFLDQQDSVIVCEPTYPGAISAFRAFTKNFVATPLDADGMDTDLLENVLKNIRKKGEPRPKFIYTIPNGHNPGGVSLSEERRRHLIDIANTFDLLVLEDDPYQLIKLEETPLRPTIQSLDTQGRVIRLDSFSKVFAPGLRIGYVSAPADLARLFVLFKQSSNLHTSMLIQEMLAKYLQAIGHESFRRHIQKNCELYRTNRDAMIQAAKAFLPPQVQYNIPREGMFIWFVLPEICDSRRMIDRYCGELKVLLVPGDAFSTQNGLKNCMRASFSLVTPEKIREGIRRFGEMIQREMESG